jgi:hypothetical protein
VASLFTPVIAMAALGGEEQPNRPLAGFSSRVQTMLDKQTAVHAKTAALDKLIKHSADKKPRPRDRQVALKLAEEQQKLVVEATKALDVPESAEAAVALREFFQQVRGDMQRVQRRLEQCDVGADTQAIENDLLDSLKEMAASLKRG